MKARFTDEQIIAIIKEQESGEKTADVYRRHGISSATFYKYSSKYGGMELSDAKRLRALEDENGKLKKLLAEQMLERGLVRHWSRDNGRALCCEASTQKMVMPAVRREAVVHLRKVHNVSQRRACDMLQIDRSTVRYLSCRGNAPLSLFASKQLPGSGRSQVSYLGSRW